MSVSQNEIERTSERTKVGLAGAIKSGHIPHVAPTVSYTHLEEERKMLEEMEIQRMQAENTYMKKRENRKSQGQQH